MKESENDYMNNKNPKISGGRPYVICAAIWFRDGNVYEHQPRNVDSGFVVCGRRHHNCFLTVCLDGDFSKMKGFEHVQGFLTSDDVFLNREEAGFLAFDVGQIEKPTLCLFSEDLY